MLARLLCLLALPLAVAVSVAGCGGGEAIPQQTAVAFVSNLDSVERGVREGECERTRPTLRGLEQRVRALPGDVDRDVRSTLGRGVQNLERLFEAECKQKPEPVPEPEPEPEPIAPPPVETAPEPEPTEPEPEAPTVIEPEEQAPEEPKEPKPEEQAPEEPKEPKEPKVDNPAGEENDVCGENPAPTC